uniref:Gypsy retrotransposon integrase-like protein 1 n=1 Tax=Varanus komodoensis TaxID=61221 RepID=A0A8D2J594_VARKO
MNCCRQVKLRLGMKKLQFKVKEVRFHGHILSVEGLKADPEKIRAILDMPHPENVKSLQHFIGFATYLAKFLPRLSEVCEPLRRLLDKDAVWHWLPKHDKAVQEIKCLVTDTPVLKYYDVTKPVTIQSDASKNGLGCCLLQDGQPIAFASRALTRTEQTYAQIEKECLNIVFACQHFHHYLYGRDKITAETDHKPLISIFKKPLLCAPKCLQSMLLTLQNYCLSVVYKPGPEMYISDTLTRATAAGGTFECTQHTVCNVQQDLDALSQINHSDYLNVTDQQLHQIKQHTEIDKSLQALKSVVLNGWPDSKEEVPLIVREYWTFRDEIGIQDGILYKGPRVIILKSLRSEVLKRIHASHIGGEACYRQAQDTLYWPNMQNEIRDFVSRCSACNEYAQAQQKEPMMSYVLPTRPWQIVSMDLLSYAGQDFLLIVDHYSDFWEIELLPDLSAETTIRRCKVQFAHHGLPDWVISDNGPQFACEQFRRFSTDWGFVHVTSSPRHPQANGKAESAVKIVKNLFKKSKYDGSDPWKAVLHWRNTPTEGMDSSPAQRLMSRRLKTSLSVANKLLEPCVVTDVMEKLRRRKQISKLTYDMSAKDLPELSIEKP